MKRYEKVLCFGIVAAALVVLLRPLVSGPSVVEAGPPKDAKYIGVRKCKLCHPLQHRTWKKNQEKHIKAFAAFDTLPAPYKDTAKKDPNCIRCHVTGYGKPGGFKSIEETPKMAGVQCEACHGPGSAHKDIAFDDPDDAEAIRASINRVPTNCADCHLPHVSRKAVADLLSKGKKEEAERMLREAGTTLDGKRLYRDYDDE